MYSDEETSYILVEGAVCPCLVPSMKFHHSLPLHCNVSCCALMTPPKLCIPS